MPALYNYFTHETLTDPTFWASDEGFGIYRWSGVFCHQNPTYGHVDVSYQGKKIAEVHKDYVDLVIPKSTLTSGIKRRWQEILKVHDISHTKRPRVTGQTKYEISFIEIDNFIDPTTQRPRRSYKTVANVVAGERIRLKYNKDTLAVTAFEVADAPIELVKDNAKYREFNAKLKNLKAVLFAQIRMGAYNKYFRTDKYNGHYNDPLMLAARTKFGTAPKGADKDARYLTHADAQQLLYKRICAWASGQTNSVVPEECLLLSGFLHYSDAYSLNEQEGHKNMERRVTNAFKSMQQIYLRENCLKIAESNNSLTSSDESHDQDRQLLPPAGLREVQVPSEAEVC